MFKFRFLAPIFLLSLICVLFLFTRLYKISEIPPSVYWDEASIGYNAYAISTDLKDEWGDFLPIHFRAFGEFKLPVYIYSVVPFVKLFGLNEFSVRIPAVLFSLGVVILTFLLTKKLTGNEIIGLWSSFLITISPWFFIFSRTGFEVTAGLMFYLLGIYFFLMRTKNYFIFFSVLSFVLSVYSYNSFRIIVPLTVLILIALEYKNIKTLLNKWTILSVLIAILSIIPIYRLFVYDAGVSRLQNLGGISYFSFVKNYLSQFDPNFLFLQGDKNLRHQQAGFGQLFLPDLILIILGLLYIGQVKTKYRWLPLILLLLGPIPAAITKESPHALRSLSMVPFMHILSAMGIYYLGHFFKKKLLVNAIFLILFLFLFANYFYSFIAVYPNISSKDWQLEYKEIFTNPTLLNSEVPILVSDKDGQPYIFALFYLKYDPVKFRREVIRNPVDKWGFSTVKSFGKFEF